MWEVRQSLKFSRRPQTEAETSYFQKFRLVLTLSVKHYHSLTFFYCMKTLLGHSLRIQCRHQEEDLDLCGGEAAKGLALLR